MAITLADAQAKVQEYLDAETNALAAQEVQLTSANGVDRRQVMASLAEIRRGLAHWRREVTRLQAEAAGAPTIGGVTFTSARFGDSQSSGG